MKGHPTQWLDPVPLAGKETLRPMVRAYVKELQQITGRFDPTAEEEDGPEVYDLHSYDLYWRRPNRKPFVIATDAGPAGFVLLNRASLSGLDLDWAIAEFYVTPSFRRSGIGRTAAIAVFSRYPGVWEVGVLAANGPARAFWPKVIGRVAAGPVEEIWDDEGPIFRFRTQQPG